MHACMHTYVLPCIHTYKESERRGGGNYAVEQIKCIKYKSNIFKVFNSFIRKIAFLCPAQPDPFYNHSLTDIIDLLKRRQVQV